jgi:hypothetical protein
MADDMTVNPRMGKTGIYIENVKKLCVLALEILKTKVELSDINSSYKEMIKMVMKYKKALEKTSYDQICDTHMILLSIIFNDHKDDILAGTDIDWIITESNNVVIQYGAHKGRESTIRIPVSDVMKIIVNMKNDFDDDSVLIEDAQKEYPVYYKYDKLFLLYFYNCLNCIDFGDDENDTIDNIINTLELELGMKAPPRVSTGGLGGLGDIFNGDMKNGFGSVVEMAMSLAKDMGVEPPEGTNMPDVSQITETITQVISHPDTKGMVEDLTSNLTNGDGNIGDALPQIFNKLSGSGTGEKIERMMRETGVTDMLDSSNGGEGTSGSSETGTVAPSENASTEASSGNTINSPTDLLDLGDVNGDRSPSLLASSTSVGSSNADGSKSTVVVVVASTTNNDSTSAPTDNNASNVSNVSNGSKIQEIVSINDMDDDQIEYA